MELTAPSLSEASENEMYFCHYIFCLFRANECSEKKINASDLYIAETHPVKCQTAKLNCI